MHKRPASENCAGDLSFISRNIRNGPSQTSLCDGARKESFGILGSRSLYGWTGIFRAAQVAPEHESVERRVFDTVANIGAQHRKELRASITVLRDLIAHALC